MIDSHCHLADDDFVADLDDVVARARAAGLTSVLCILAAHDGPEVARGIALARKWPAVRLATGVHPHAAGEFAGRVADATAAVERAIDAMPDVCAIGEVGLDYHYNFAPRELQQELFAAQIDLAIHRDVPLIVHTREAMEDTIRLLGGVGSGQARGVIHCFSGTADEAQAALELGFYVSFSGILTFPKADTLRAAAGLVPLDRLLVETDAPFLAPVPYRGKRNEPAWVVATAATLAAIKGLAPADLDEAVTANFFRLFGLASQFVDTPANPMV